MNASRLIKVVGLAALPVLAAALPTAIGQPAAGGQPPAATQPPPPPPHEGGPRGDGGPDGEGSKWRQEYRQELREHPRIARAIVALHEVKEHLEKAPHDFGGHKAAAIKSVDESIKELKEAIKFDAKAEPPKRDGGPRGPKGAAPKGDQ
jgi:hypothetical protein